MTDFPIAAIRDQFPALLTLRDEGRPRVYADNPAGTQVPQQVLDRVSAMLVHANANLGGETCARGALLGSLLGAANGSEDIPGELVEKLARYEELDALADRFLPLAMTDFSQ